MNCAASRLLSVIMSFFIMIPFTPVHTVMAAADVWDGSLTPLEPVDGVYYVARASELAWIANKTIAGSNTEWNIKLLNDLDLNNHRWSPIGTDSRPFFGSFDGGGYNIYNLFVNAIGNHRGLFGAITRNDTEIKNLNIVNCSVGGVSFVGALVGLASGGEISNCFASGSVRGTSKKETSSLGEYYIGGQYIGGLVGYQNPLSAILDCYSDCNVSAFSPFYVGGFAGRQSGEIKNSHSSGQISVDNTGFVGIVGGFVGSAHGFIENCFSTGDVFGSDTIGGFVGGIYDGGTINNCYSTGGAELVENPLTGSGEIGGFAGKVASGYISNCYSVSAFSGNMNVDGFVGFVSDEDENNIENCYWNTDQFTDPLGAEGIAIGLTTQEMMEPSFAEMLNGAPPSGAWAHVTGDYPKLTNKIGITIPTVSITLNKTETTICLTLTETLVAKVAPKYATSNNIIWESSDTRVAIVTDGVVTPVSEGTVTITATTGDYLHTAVCSVTVKDTMTIAEIKQMPVDGLAITKGIVTFVMVDTYSIYIQDTTAGALVVSRENYLPADIAQGDEIKVAVKVFVRSFVQLYLIDDSSCVIVGHNNTVTPDNVTLSELSKSSLYQDKLVYIRNAIIGKTSSYETYAYTEITDASGDATIHTSKNATNNNYKSLEADGWTGKKVNLFAIVNDWEYPHLTIRSIDDLEELEEIAFTKAGTNQLFDWSTGAFDVGVTEHFTAEDGSTLMLCVVTYDQGNKLLDIKMSNAIYRQDNTDLRLEGVPYMAGNRVTAFVWDMNMKPMTAIYGN